MADRALFRFTPDGFRPYNTKAQEEAARCKLGDVVELKLTRVRNPRFHRLYFAILRLISQNSNPPISETAALHFAKLAAGIGEVVQDSKGDPHFIPGSISFGSMDQEAFDAFVKVSIPPLVGRFMRGTAPEAVIREAMELAA